jgi:hypothetical protein
VRGVPLTIQPCTYGFASLIDQDTSIVVKFDHTSIRPLQFLDSPDYDGMPDVSSSDLVRCRRSDCGTWSGFCEVSLLLYDDDYSIPLRPGQLHELEEYSARHVEPIFACLFIFRTLAHSTTAAPELSMQLSIVYNRL